jgi:hypothetical protein
MGQKMISDIINKQPIISSISIAVSAYYGFKLLDVIKKDDFLVLVLMTFLIYVYVQSERFGGFNA